jgi:hypothetical protein
VRQRSAGLGCVVVFNLARDAEGVPSIEHRSLGFGGPSPGDARPQLTEVIDLYSGLRHE